MGDAEIPKSSLRLPFPDCPKLRLGVDQVVDLHQIDRLGLQTRKRALHRIDPGLLATGPDLSGKKERIAQFKSR